MVACASISAGGAPAAKTGAAFCETAPFISAFATRTATAMLALRTVRATRALRAPLVASRRLMSSLPPHTVVGLPALSPTMTQGNIAGYLVKEGDAVSAGDRLAVRVVGLVLLLPLPLLRIARPGENRVLRFRIVKVVTRAEQSEEVGLPDML